MRTLTTFTAVLMAACVACGGERKDDSQKFETNPSMNAPARTVPGLPSRAHPLKRSNVAPKTPKGGFRFAWPAGSRATVMHRWLQQRQQTTSSTMKFEVHVGRIADGSKDLKVSLHNFDILSIGGRTVPPKARPHMDKKLRPWKLYPAYRISPRGGCKELLGFDRYYPTLIPPLPTDGTSKVTPEKYRRLVRESKPMAVHEVRIVWRNWVAMWVGGELKPGERRTLPATPESLGPRHIRHHGGVQNYPGHVELSLKIEITGDNARKALAPQIAMVAAASPSRAKEMFGSPRSVTIVHRSRVVTHPLTLMPVRASRSSTGTITLAGGERRTIVEAHDYTFSWSK